MNNAQVCKTEQNGLCIDIFMYLNLFSLNICEVPT